MTEWLAREGVEKLVRDVEGANEREQVTETGMLAVRRDMLPEISTMPPAEVGAISPISPRVVGRVRAATAASLGGAAAAAHTALFATGTRR